MNKLFYMYMNVQGMGRNVLVCLITILLFVSCQSYKRCLTCRMRKLWNRPFNRKTCMMPK